MSLTENFNILEKMAELAIAAYAHTNALRLESYMKINAKWENHTGDARRRLNGSCERVEDGYLIRLAHGVDYGVFLELSHEKKYAITKPTAKLKGPEVIKGLEGLFDKINKR